MNLMKAPPRCFPFEVFSEISGLQPVRIRLTAASYEEL
jgi:hypothetical protein